jgi:hypothetical protein
LSVPVKHWFYTVPLRLRSPFRRDRVEQELDEELRYHIERQIEENVAKGMTPEDARYALWRRLLFDYNPFALVVVIELARGKGKNPEVPHWLQADYDLALKDIAQYGLENLNEEWDTGTLQSILGLIAIFKGSRDLGELIFEIDADGAKELLNKYDLDRLNEALLDRVNASGEIFLSHTRLNERYTLRLVVGHIRTSQVHVARAWELLRETANHLIQK